MVLGLLAAWAGAIPAPAAAQANGTVLTVRARGVLAGNVGPTMVIRINGSVVASTEVRATTATDYRFITPTLAPGAQLDIAFTNDAVVNGSDRGLQVTSISSGGQTVLPNASGVVYDRGAGALAYDGLDTLPGQAWMHWNGALRLTWPGAPVSADAQQQRRYEAARFLQQASFGPTTAEIDRVVSIGPAAWITQQIALPFTADHVAAVQRQYAKGQAWWPLGANYDPQWVVQQFWSSVANSPDQLRRRVGYAWQQIFVVSQDDSNLWEWNRPYANYIDNLNRLALGNFRTLLEEVALSPVMGIYLSHIRNRREDPATGRLPDENFAREVMQLFTIGLVELNLDGTPRLGADGKPIETYTNADVMALAKVFTGWSWGLPDDQTSEDYFRYGIPPLQLQGDQGHDLRRMRAYPGQHSTAEKRLFQGKAQAVTIPANTPAAEGLRIALDTLFRHPNVGPFIGRQLIQRLVTSQPSPAYVARVAQVFNNNGQGVRGDLAAVVRAILLDPEARQAPSAATVNAGKLREPILRVAHWMRAFGATSVTGEYRMAWELYALANRPMNAPSVFNHYRPGYIPPNTDFAARGATAPEFQLVNESTNAAWVNLAESMAVTGIGWTGTGSQTDVQANMNGLVNLASTGNVAGLVEQLNLLLYAGQMPASLKAAIPEALAGVSGTTALSHLTRARLALFLALSSPAYLVQR